MNQNSQTFVFAECLSILWALYRGCQAIRDIIFDRLIEQMSYFVLGPKYNQLDEEKKCLLIALSNMWPDKVWQKM